MDIKLDFEELQTSKKTKNWEVYCRGEHLGIVQWFSHWRKYCFFPDADTIFDSKCLAKLQDFLALKNLEHRNKLRKTKTGTIRITK